MKEVYLQSIQKILKDVARMALNTDFNMDVDLGAKQWNKWTEEGLERTLACIRKDVELAEQHLEKAKKC
jgi:hypothetical protein